MLDHGTCRPRRPHNVLKLFTSYGQPTAATNQESEGQRIAFRLRVLRLWMFGTSDCQLQDVRSPPPSQRIRSLLLALGSQRRRGVTGVSFNGRSPSCSHQRFGPSSYARRKDRRCLERRPNIDVSLSSMHGRPTARTRMSSHERTAL